MAFDVEAAKADGYTDEEIQSYLRSQGMATPESQPGSQPVAPVPPNPPVDRSAEQMATLGGAAALGAGALGASALAGQALKAAGQAVSGGMPKPGPVAPPQMPPAAPMNPPTASPSYTAPTAAAGEAAQMNAAKNIVQKLALDKVLKGAGIVGAGYELGKNLFYTSPEDIAKLKAAEARKKAGLQ